MRMRFKPWARAELQASDFHADAPAENRGKWKSLYARPEQPFHLELGSGKGGFISKLAAAHPEVNYLGIDITDKVLALAKRNIDKEYEAVGRTPDNVMIAEYNIEYIGGMLSEQDTVDRIYINFCNPWTRKNSSRKHRLTHPRQLILYREFLKQGGEIYFKTDDDTLFEESLPYFEAAGFSIIWLTRDLHAEEPEWNIRTEHENMFTEQGIRIKALIAVMDQPLSPEQREVCQKYDRLVELPALREKQAAEGV